MPDRIVSLAPSNTEILYELGVADRVVATTAICDHPPTAREKPSIGGWTNPDVDAVAEHDPDLVLAADALQDGAVAACEEAGLNVLQVTPTRLHEVFNAIKRIGEAVDAEDAARELVEEMNGTLRETAVPDTGPRVYTEEWHDPPMAGGNWVPRMVRLAGGEPFLDEGERSREVDAEEIRAFDPEHIVLHPCGYDDAADTDAVMEREGWNEVAAVETGRVHVVDDTLLNRPGPRIVDGVAALRDIIGGRDP